MGNNSPGKMRRQGREAFVEGCDPEVECPKHLSKMHNSYQKESWIEGWMEAEKDHNDELKETNNDELLHDCVMEEIESLERSSNVSGLVMFLIKRGIIT